MLTKKELIFIHLSCCLALIHAFGYFWLGVKEDFNICIIAMIICDLLYIPASTIRSVRIFPAYLLLFSSILIFITAFTTSELFNNYSALLCIFVGILITPKYKKVFMAFYLVVCSIAFCIAGDPVYYLLIHFSRSLWIFVIYDFIIYVKYERKPVILFDEERELLEQLANGEQIKSLELNGLSERTIRRRLDAAQRRNGLKNREELKELYIRTYKNK